jgi:predicted phosphate transport protein (TIGR00153 family)
MGLRPQPRNTVFFKMFADASANISACVEVLREFVHAPPERREELARRMHDVEHDGDNTTHDIIDQLNRAFITPFDREDIYRLAVRLDDVIDYIDAAVDLANLYQLGDLPEGVYAQVDLLCQAAAATAEAMPKLAKPGTLETYWVQANDLENQADQVYRRLLSWLFSGELDTLTVLKLKEIVDQLESAADAFEHVADVVHTIAVKES